MSKQNTIDALALDRVKGMLDFYKKQSEHKYKALGQELSSFDLGGFIEYRLREEYLEKLIRDMEQADSALECLKKALNLLAISLLANEYTDNNGSRYANVIAAAKREVYSRIFKDLNDAVEFWEDSVSVGF